MTTAHSRFPALKHATRAVSRSPTQPCMSTGEVTTSMRHSHSKRKLAKQFPSTQKNSVCAPPCPPTKFSRAPQTHVERPACRRRTLAKARLFFSQPIQDDTMRKALENNSLPLAFRLQRLVARRVESHPRAGYRTGKHTKGGRAVSTISPHARNLFPAALTDNR